MPAQCTGIPADLTCRASRAYTSRVLVLARVFMRAVKREARGLSPG